MRKLLPFLVFALIFSNAFSQDLLSEQSINLAKVSSEDKIESYPVINSDNGQLALFLIDRYTLYAQLFDKDFNLIRNIQAGIPEKTFTSLLGCYIKGNSYNLIFTNGWQDIFFSKTINFNDGTESGRQLPIVLNGEAFLQAFSYNNKFCFLTLRLKSSVLKVYSIDDADKYQVKEIDLSAYKFSGSKKSTLFDVLRDRDMYAPNETVVYNIDNTNPNPLDLTSKANKIYCIGNKIYLTLDNDTFRTTLITIDLNDFSSKVKSFQQGFIYCGDDAIIKTNSYIYKNNLFQIAGCQQELSFQKYDLSTDSLVKALKINKDQEIYFKNSPIIQEGRRKVIAKNPENEPDKTAVFFRKLSTSDIGISLYQTPVATEVTIGGFKEINKSSYAGMAIGIQMGLLGAIVYASNPAMFGYTSYARTKSTYFKCLFDTLTFEHLPGEIQKNAFDKISDFLETLKTSSTVETIIKMNDYYVYGYYDRKAKKYYLRKFTD
jgi:hypothetical protein